MFDSYSAATVDKYAAALTQPQRWLVEDCRDGARRRGGQPVDVFAEMIRDYGSSSLAAGRGMNEAELEQVAATLRDGGAS